MAKNAISFAINDRTGCSAASMSPAIAPDLRDLLTLHLLPGLGPRLTAALLQRFGSAAAVLRAGAAQLRDVPHIGPKLSDDLSQAMRSVDVDAELALIAQHGVHLRVLGSPQQSASAFRRSRVMDRQFHRMCGTIPRTPRTCPSCGARAI